MKNYSINLFFIFNSFFFQNSIFSSAVEPFVKILTANELDGFYIVEKSIRHPGKTSAINLVTDGTSTYILKQIIDPNIHSQLFLVTDAVCSRVGTVCQIPVNEVFFVPYNTGSHLKIYPERAATLHTFISGKDLDTEMPDFITQATDDFSIFMRIKRANSYQQKKHPLAEHQQGLTTYVIKCMSLHADFAYMVALDTFVANIDRSNENILYNKAKGQFYGIDQAWSLRYNLAHHCFERIQHLKNNGYMEQCSQNILKCLNLYKKTLQTLCETFDANLINDMIDHLIPQLVDNTLENVELQQVMQCLKNIFKSNREDVLKIIEIL